MEEDNITKKKKLEEDKNYNIYEKDKNYV